MSDTLDGAKDERKDKPEPLIVPDIGAGAGIGINVGGGVVIDPTDGSVGVKIGGIAVDLFGS